MRDVISKILPPFIIAGFIIYWITLFILAMPPNFTKKMLVNAAPRYNSLVGNSWKVFSPPFTYSNRLYYIVRERANPNHTDTIEVLENIAKQKQQHAPFNQRENIIDHLVNHDVDVIIYIVWKDKKRPSGNDTGTTDSINIANAMAAAADNINYRTSRATLLNYANVVLKDRKTDTAGKEIKMIITQKKIQPFKYLGDTSLKQKEIIFVETSYNPFRKW